MTVMHKHHIVPRYRCKELGIDPDFEENIVEVTREQHAMIHWGYQCGDLKPLLEVCDPSPEILEMISFGDGRDTGAAVLLAKGEIDGITGIGRPKVPMSEETKEKLREARKRQLQDEEYLKKYREGVRRASKLKRGVNNPFYGKTHSEETKKKISETKKIMYAKGEIKHPKDFAKKGEDNQSYKHGKLIGARNNPDVRKKYKAEWYQKNKERINAKKKNSIHMGGNN